MSAPRLFSALRRCFILPVLPALALSLVGCAHPLSLSPNLGSLAGSGANKIDKRVGLVITQADRELEVTTPGGGGDSVRYFPYRDLEPALYLALSESFASVTRLATVTDPKVAAESLSYVVRPSLKTTSFSDSLLTWPPTLFTIEVVAQLNDPTGKLVAEVRVMGEGRASFSEFKGQPGLAANRAAEDAVKKLIQALGTAGALR